MGVIVFQVEKYWWQNIAYCILCGVLGRYANWYLSSDTIRLEVILLKHLITTEVKAMGQ